MTSRWRAAGVLLAAVTATSPLFTPRLTAQAGAPPAAPTNAAPPVPTAAELTAAINTLGAFDFSARMTASRTVRRAPGAMAVPALTAAVKQHKDSYVQYRALVLLAGFGDASTPDVMRASMADRNDRLRAVAYAWFEHHPSPATLPSLIEALPREQSEFVRPSLMRAIAAHAPDARAVAAALPLVTSGEDFFRGEMIAALGDYKVGDAREAIAGVAQLDGPLQDVAVLALGALGDAKSLDVLARLQRVASRERQPAVAAAICLLGTGCDAHHAFLAETLRFAADTSGYQILLRAATRAVGALADRSDQQALNALFDAGKSTDDSVRAPVALAIGQAAVRRPSAIVSVLGARKDQAAAIELLRDGFDMLEEDFEEELFYVELRRAYWAASPNSSARQLLEAIIQKLEF